jgi:20S proteasome subunit alpha 6
LQKSTGPHLFQTDPAGNYFEWKAMAIGARSQTAKTYLEKHFEGFPESSLDGMIQHGLRALNGCTEAEKQLTAESVTVAFVGKDCKFTVVDGVKVAPYLKTLHEALAASDAGAAAGGKSDEEGDVDLADGKDSEGGDVDI